MRQIAAAFAFLVLVACGNPLAAEPTLIPTPTPTCQQQSATFITQVQPIFQEWQDASTLAGNTPRASLSAQIDKLQGIRRTVQALQPPDCAKVLQENLVAAMDTGIQAYLDFLAQKPENQVSAQFSLAGQQLDLFSRNLAHLQAGEAPETVPASATASVKSLASAVELIQSYEQATIKFEDSSLADGTPRSMGTTPDGVIIIEFVGPKEAPIQAGMFASVKEFDKTIVERAEFSMIGMAQAMMPDWAEAEAWIKQAVVIVGAKPESKSSIIVGNRLVTVERSGVINNDQALSLVIKVT